jgi:tetrahydromethanopterin S-methyltransferase subunit G
MKRIPLKNVKTPAEVMHEASQLNNYDFENIKGSIKELELILENNVIGDQLLRSLDNIHKDIGILKDRVIETYIRLLKQGQQIF